MHRSILLFLLFLSLGAAPSGASPQCPPSQPAPQGEVHLARVVDGDSLWVLLPQGCQAKLRLLWVDTEESVHPRREKNSPFGRLTSQWLKSWLPPATSLRLACQKRPDRYRRSLCLVWRGEELLNLKLVQEGWSPYYTKYGIPSDPALHQLFNQAQERATQEGLGIWQQGHQPRASLAGLKPGPQTKGKDQP